MGTVERGAADERRRFWRDAWALAAGLLDREPTDEVLAQLAPALDDLAARGQRVLGVRLTGTEFMSRALTEGAGGEAGARTEYRALFFGPGKMPAPPWESVYLSPERLVMREPAYQVLQSYAQAGLGYDGMTETPPDHVARELGFLAALADPAVEVDQPEAKAAAFMRDHVARWVPMFCRDVEHAVPGGFYAGLALLLRELVELGSPRLMQVGTATGSLASSPGQ